jgi:hypothetical protein
LQQALRNGRALEELLYQLGPELSRRDLTAGNPGASKGESAIRVRIFQAILNLATAWLESDADGSHTIAGTHPVEPAS